MTKTNWHAMQADEILDALHTDSERGLDRNEAQKRLQQYGYNELSKTESASVSSLLLHQFKNVLIIILLIATVFSALVGETLDALLIIVIVLFCAVLGFIQEYRAERALEALREMLSPTVTVLRHGKDQEIPSKELVPGDILLLEAGDRVPADARVLASHSLKCDEAPLTGESLPVAKEVVRLSEDLPVGDRINMTFAGTTVAYGRGRAVVVATAMNTEFGKIAAEVISIKAEKTPLERRTEEIGKWLGFIAISACVLVAGVSLVREALAGSLNFDFLATTVMFAVALAVAAVPEALPAIVTGALAIGMHQMAQRNALIRRMPAVETLGCTTVICTDKTGTLTKGEMTIRKIYCDDAMLEVSGVGYEPVGQIQNTQPTDVAEDRSLGLLLRGGLLCNDAMLTSNDQRWTIKGDPTEAAFLVAAAKAGLEAAHVREQNPRIEEIPFSSERKCMTTIHENAAGQRLAFLKGAPEVVLGKCSHIQSDGAATELESSIRERMFKVNGDMARGALRVLAVAYKELGSTDNTSEQHVEQGMVFLGLVGMMDPPREEAIEAIKVCRQVRIKPVMITGDHKVTAVAVATEIGIHVNGDKVLTGEELGRLEDKAFEAIVDQVTVYARVSPMDKLKIVRAWKHRGEVVAMTGDGVNDAPALKHADIGIAMGITGSDVAKEACDMVLNDDNFATIVKAIERGRWIYDNIKKYLTYLLRCNITEVVVIGGVVLALGPKYLPLLPAAILYINLITDGLPALALGVAPPDPDIMQRPPRPPKESVFSTEVKAFIGMAFLIEVPFCYFLFFHELDQLILARTEIFFIFIFVEAVIALNLRSMKYSVFRLPPHGSLVIATVAQILLTLVLLQIPSINGVFGIGLPSLSVVVIITVFSVVVLASMEIVKAILHRTERRT